MPTRLRSRHGSRRSPPDTEAGRVRRGQTQAARSRSRHAGSSTSRSAIVRSPAQRDSLATWASTASAEQRGGDRTCQGCAIQPARPTALTATVTSQSGRTHRQPSRILAFASQLRVKLGMIRPPINPTRALPGRCRPGSILGSPRRCASSGRRRCWPAAAGPASPRARLSPLLTGDDFAGRRGRNQSKKT